MLLSIITLLCHDSEIMWQHWNTIRTLVCTLLWSFVIRIFLLWFERRRHVRVKKIEIHNYFFSQSLQWNLSPFPTYSCIVDILKNTHSKLIPCFLLNKRLNHISCWFRDTKLEQQQNAAHCCTSFHCFTYSIFGHHMQSILFFLGNWFVVD